MKLKKGLLFIALSLWSLLSYAQMFEQPVSWAYSLSQKQDNLWEVCLTATVAAPWHMYDMGPYDGGPTPTSFTFELPSGAQLVGSTQMLNPPERLYDSAFDMNIGTFTGSAQFVQQIQTQNNSLAGLKVTAEWQACDDGTCLPPEEETIDLSLTEDGEAVPALTVEKSASGSLWSIILQAMLFGLVALLTPCVFPMVPMTVSFFLKSGGSKAKGRWNASMYGFFIVLLYTLPIAAIIGVTYITGGAAVTADIFNWLATHWLPNLLFFLVFVVFAASFFGAFEITMPSKWTTKTDAKADRGGLLGIFFLSLTLVLVSFSCTGPIVGTVLIKSTQGAVWEPIITMLAFSVAFALPFTILAMVPSLMQRLPKSGGWLNSIKVVLGFLELALALKFFSTADQTYHWGILDREVYLAIWIVIFSLLGLYLLGKIRFANDSPVEHLSVFRLVLVILTFSFVVYLLPGMWGAPLKALSGYMPPVSTQDFVLDATYKGTSGLTVQVNGNEASEATESLGTKRKYSDILHIPYGIDGFFHYGEAMEYAKAHNMPVFLDFTGLGCVNCREMESRVWSDPRVLNLLKTKFVVLALYSDDKTKVDESEWVIDERGRELKTLGKINSYFARTQFGVNAQPTYFILDNQGKPLLPPRVYDLNIDGFVSFLEEGIRAYYK